MVGMEQQFRRIAEGRVAREPGRIGMPVRADDRQVGYLLIESARDLALRQVGGEQSVGGEQQRARHGNQLSLSTITGARRGLRIWTASTAKK